VVICGRCTSLIRSIDPVRGAVVSKGSSSVDEDEEASDCEISGSCIGPSYHLTLLSCLSLTESKQIGQRAHLFAEVLK